MAHAGVCLYPRKSTEADASIDRASVTTNMETMCCHSCFSHFHSDRFESLSVFIRCEISSYTSHVL